MNSATVRGFRVIQIEETSSMSNALTNILTDAGTNEVEVLVFMLDGGSYGVNVAKVREIIERPNLTQLPESHPAVRGVFQLREHVLPLVDLRAFFNMEPSPDDSTARVVVTEFNSGRLGFLVDRVERIHRLSWKDMDEVPWTSADGDQDVTSVAHIEEEMVLMLDFERIAFKIAGIAGLEQADPESGAIDRSHLTVLLAEDSVMMRQMVGDSLGRANFGQVVLAHDGEEAWRKICEMVEGGSPPDVIVTDIEMPRMDGLHLTKRIKEDPKTSHLPVIVFSSLVSDDNLKKCASVGADRQLTKPEFPQLVRIIEELLGERADV